MLSESQEIPLSKLKVIFICGKSEDMRLAEIVAKKMRTVIKNTHTKLIFKFTLCNRNNERGIFIQTIPITKQNKTMGQAYSKLLELYYKMLSCPCEKHLFRERISLDPIVLEK